MQGLWSRWLADIRLSDEAFAARHRALLVVLWLSVPLLVGLALVHVDDAVPDPRVHNHIESTLVWSMVSVVAGCAALGSIVRGRRPATMVVSFGLLLAAATLVPAGGGLTDLHFGFFVVLGLISVYLDWTVLVLSVVVVAAHHLITGTIAPETLYSNPTAQADPVQWAALHVAFVVAMCAVEVAYWHFAARAEAEKDRIRTQADLAVRRSEERFRAIVQDSSDVIFVVEPDGRIASVSPGVTRVMGYEPAHLLGQDYTGLLHEGDRGDLGQADQGRAEVRVRHADGAWHWHDVTLRDLTDHPAVRAVVANHRDITERRTFQELLLHEASHDSLTDLANRAALLRGLEEALADGAADRTRVAVLYLDLDGFKATNDTYGHDSGDALLVATARTLRRCVLGSDLVGRLGGDEFGIVLRHIPDPDAAAVVAHRIVDELRRPVVLGGATVRPRASIGIALSEPGHDGTDELLHRADTAMYHAKRAQSGGWQFFVPGMHDRTGDGSALEDDLRRAVDEEQLRLRYQSIVDIRDGALLGFEALVRWEHPRRGLLGPTEFIPIAEQSGLIDEIGAWVLDHACREVRAWQDEHPGLGRLRLNVNVAPAELDRPTLVADVMATLADTGFDPRDLVLEVTESALVKDASAVPQLNALNALGIRIALDDFGTGYSSLRYLTQLPVDILKLDRHFVAELNGTPEGSAVAESVMRLGQILHLEVIAEGIEHRAQETELALLGFRSGQGFLYSRPLTPPQARQVLATARPASADTPL